VVGNLGEHLMARLRQEAAGCYEWSNGPGDTYPEHTHGYRKVLYCVAGSITFTLPDRAVRLLAGDRVELPAGTPHGALVGPEGCVCIEGRGRNMAPR
jgi:quercetin dioxygenase-like cupin family protein